MTSVAGLFLVVDTSTFYGLRLSFSLVLKASKVCQFSHSAWYDLNTSKEGWYFILFDLGHAFLFILKTPIRIGERFYSQVWGTTDYEYVGDKLFIKVGGFCNEVLIDPDEIRCSLPMPDAPQTDDVLVRTNEYDDVEADLLESVKTVA